MIEGAANEIGVGGLVNVGLGDSDPTATTTGYGLGPGAQVWYAWHPTDHVSAGVVAFAGTPSLFGGGALFRWLPLTDDRVRAGIDLGLGFAWVEVGLPMGFRLTDRVWLYTAPSVGIRTSQTVRVPVGLSFRLGDHVQLTPEASVGYGNTPIFMGDVWPGLQVYGALGSSFRF